MAGGEVALLNEPLDLLGQGQQPHGVGHRGAGFAHPVGGLLLGQAVVLDEAPVSRGLLHGVQVLPLEIFNEAQLHHLSVVGFDDGGGDFLQPRHAGRPPAALPGDDLIIA